MSEENIQEIYFYSQSSNDSFENESQISDFLKELVHNIYLKDSFLINYIFLGKNDILEMNRKYLNHTYPTDVITFDFSDDFGVFGGDIFICPEVVRENALEYNTDYQMELIRVMSHGILHLLGYDDTSEEEQQEIREQEEICLEIYRNRENM